MVDGPCRAAPLHPQYNEPMMMKELYQKDTHTTRWAGSQDPTNAQGPVFDTVAPGETKTLLSVAGCGLIQRIWLALQPHTPERLRAYRLEMFWDGAETPAVSVPLGDFFCVGPGVVSFENELFTSLAGCSFSCTAPMPFCTGAHITLTNESGESISHLSYTINYTLTRQPEADVLYFHSHWRRESPTTLGQDFVILPHVAGHGRFLGTALYIMTDPVYGRSWWGGGDVKLYLDGDANHPGSVSTSMANYIGAGWGMSPFSQRYQGCLVADAAYGRYMLYRLHVPDPITFHQGCRVTAQQIGSAPKEMVRQLAANGAPLHLISAAGGRQPFLTLVDARSALGDPDIAESDWCHFYRQDDWTAVAYFYLDKSTNSLPLLAPLAVRVAGLATTTAVTMSRLEYRPRSLRRKDNGFAFNLQNPAEPLTIIGLHSLTVNEQPVAAADITLISMHGVTRPASAITPGTPLPLPTHTTARIQVNGVQLADRVHHISLRLQVLEVEGMVAVSLSDQLGEKT